MIKRSIIIITNEWDKFRRRYRSMMSEMIKYKDIENILFIESPLTLFSFVRYVLNKMNDRDKERWQRIFKKGIIYKVEDIAGNIYVITPFIPFPFYSSKSVLKINNFFLYLFQKVTTSYLIKKLVIKDIIFWVCNPSYYVGLIVDKKNVNLFIYDLCDDYLDKLNDKTTCNAKWLKGNDEYLTKRADIIFVSSEKLFQDRFPKNPNIFRIPNGVNLDLFRENYSIEPDDLKYIPRPRLVYVGNISSAIDLELLQWINKSHPEWFLVMIGPVHGKMLENALKKISTISLLGVKSYEEAVMYTKLSDVSIIPYLKTPWALSIDSLKIYNFLASGKPVVSTEIGGSECFHDVIFVGKDRNDFLQKIALALNETKEESNRRREKQLELMAEHTWQKRAEKVYSLIMTHLKR